MPSPSRFCSSVCAAPAEDRVVVNVSPVRPGLPDNRLYTKRKPTFWMRARFLFCPSRAKPKSMHLKGHPENISPHSCFHRHVLHVAHGCPSVTTLDLSEWLGLTDAGLAAVGSKGQLSSLRRLLVSRCPNVGDTGIRAVLDGCLALEELSAGSCVGVSSLEQIDCDSATVPGTANMAQ